MVKGIAGNIQKFYAYTFFECLTFLSPVLVVFLLSKGLSYTQIMFLYGLVTLMPVLIEIPTGYIADVKGRKFSLTLGAFSFVLGTGLFMFADSFQAFVTAFLLVGFGRAFVSGADCAFVYDTLLTEKKEKQFPRIWGNVQFILFTTTGVAALIGGWLSEINFLIPILLTVAALTISLLVVFSFKEPVREKPILMKDHLTILWQFLKFSLVNSRIRVILVYTILFSPLIFIYQVLVQPLTVSFGLSLTWLGVIYAGLMICTGLGPMVAKKFQDSLSVKWKFFAVSLIGGAAVIIVSVIKSPWILLALILPALAHGISRVLISVVINSNVSSDRRATVLSIQSMAFTASFTAIAIVSGRIIDAYSFKPVLLIAGLLPIMGALLILFLSPKKLQIYA